MLLRKSYQIINIEGTDGTGKGTQAKLLEKKLKSLGYKVLNLDFPQYKGFFGQEVGRLLSDKNGQNAQNLDIKSTCLWYALDRYHSLKITDLREYDYIIFNRYVMSNMVYQSSRKNAPEGISDWIYGLEHNILKLPIPDYYIILDVDINQSQKNVDNKGQREYVEDRDVYEESTELLMTAQNKYRQLTREMNNVDFIKCDKDGQMKSAEAIHKDILKSLKMANIIN